MPQSHPAFVDMGQRASLTAGHAGDGLVIDGSQLEARLIPFDEARDVVHFDGD